MQEVVVQVFGYLWGVWRYRWVALALAWLVALAGWLFVYQMPSQYLATARVHVDTNTVLRPLLRGLAIQPNITQRIELMSRTLLSRPNLEKLMRMTDMDIQAKNEAQKNQIMDMLKENIRLAGDRNNTSLYTVSFKHRDRDVAKRVVQSLITVFIESTLGNERADSADAQTFLDEQIADYEKRLIEAESRLAKFKQENVGILPGQSGGYYERMAIAKTELSTASLQLQEATHRRNELRRQIAGEDPVFLSSGNSGSQSPLDARIHSLEAKLDDLLTRYTEKYPEVVQIRNLIADLEEEKQQEIDKAFAGQSTDYSGLTSSPVYQQMRTMLAEAEARVAEMSVRVREYRARVAELEGMVDNIPIIESELKQLNRDYSVVLQQHNELLARRESARISQDVEQKANDLVFRVIDPPFVPKTPNEPNKLILNSAVMLAGLGVGGGIALLLSLIYPVVIDKLSLVNVSGLPVLGAVSLVQSEAEKKKALKSRIRYVVLLVLLIVAFVAVNFIEWY